jgi:hypothetical protein
MDRGASKRFQNGLTRIELLVAVILVGSLALPICLSSLSRARLREQRMACADNLRQLSLAWKTFALDHAETFPTTISDESARSPELIHFDAFRYFQKMSNELSNPKILVCPADVRKPATNWSAQFANTNLSYFVGLDCQDSCPQMLLFGDRNLTNGPLPPNHILIVNTNYPVEWTSEMHHNQGNVGLADGSVQQYSGYRLQEALSPSVTNRLAIP